MHDPAYARLVDEGTLVVDAAVTLLRARIAADLTQAQVAARMGTTQSVVARMEGARVLPSLRSIERYAKAVGAVLAITLTPV